MCERSVSANLILFVESFVGVFCHKTTQIQQPLDLNLKGYAGLLVEELVTVAWQSANCFILDGLG